MQSDCYYSRVRKEWVKIEDPSILEMAYGADHGIGSNSNEGIFMQNIPEDSNWLASYESARKEHGDSSENRPDTGATVNGFVDAFAAIASPESWSSLLCGPVSNKGGGHMKEIKNESKFREKLATADAMDQYYSPVRQTWTTLESKSMADIAYGTILDHGADLDASIYSFESPSAAAWAEHVAPHGDGKAPHETEPVEVDLGSHGAVHDAASEFTADFILSPRSQIWSVGDSTAVESVLRAQFAMTDAELDELRSLIAASDDSQLPSRRGNRLSTPGAGAHGAGANGAEIWSSSHNGSSQAGSARPASQGRPAAGFRYTYDDVLDMWRLEYCGAGGTGGTGGGEAPRRSAWDHGGGPAEERPGRPGQVSQKTDFLKHQRSSLAAGVQQALRARLTEIRSAAEARSGPPEHKTYQLRARANAATVPLRLERGPTDHLGRSHVVTDPTGASWTH